MTPAKELAELILGLDLSHYQGTVNFGALKAAGRDFVYIKATEGIGYVDPSFATYRAQAHAAGMIVGLYHFGRDNDPTSEFAYFAGVVGDLQPGEFLVLDQEVAHAGGNVPWCSKWLAAASSHYGINPFIYMNQGASTGVVSGDWTQVAKTYGLILARYDNAPSVQTSVPYWGAVQAKQYSDAGTVLGVSSPCDVDVFYGTTDQLLAYGKGGTPTPTPPEDVVTPQDISAISDAVANRMIGPAGAAWQTWNKAALAADTASTAAAAANAAASKVDALAAQVAKLPTSTGSVDANALAAALVAQPGFVDGLVNAVVPALAADVAKRIGNG